MTARVALAELNRAAGLLPNPRMLEIESQTWSTPESPSSRYLHALADLGVLRTRRLGREKLFFHPRLLDLLTREPNEFEPYP